MPVIADFFRTPEGSISRSRQSPYQINGRGRFWQCCDAAEATIRN